MRTPLRHPKSLSLKILRVSPYNSKILVLSRLEVHCFHRPEGEGGTPGRAFPSREYPRQCRLPAPYEPRNPPNDRGDVTVGCDLGHGGWLALPICLQSQTGFEDDRQDGDSGHHRAGKTSPLLMAADYAQRGPGCTRREWLV